MAIETAGFEVRDVVTHLFGTGFPKSLSVSKAIDRAAGAEREVVGTRKLGGNAAQSTKEKGGTYASNTNSVGVAPIDVPVTAPATDAAKQWDGWGTALKPAAEFWWMGRKPLAGTVASNVQEHGTGALNIDACRISADFSERSEAWKRSGHSAKPDAAKIAAPAGNGIETHPGGKGQSSSFRRSGST